MEYTRTFFLECILQLSKMHDSTTLKGEFKLKNICIVLITSLGCVRYLSMLFLF